MADQRREGRGGGGGLGEAGPQKEGDEGVQGEGVRVEQRQMSSSL